MIAAKALRGVPFEAARLYGMPHVGAAYTSRTGVDAYRMEEGALCPVCGRPATNVHHEPPKGRGRSFALPTPMGDFAMRPALIALCGNGIVGCHGRRHNGLLSLRWEWDDPASEEAWLDGSLLSHGYAPHDARLYGLGRWVAYDGMEAVAEWRG